MSDIENPAKAVMRFMSPKGMQATGEGLLRTLRDEPADILLLSPFAELAAHPLAEARGVPSIGIRLQAMSTTADFPPSILGGWSAGPMLNRAAGRFGAGWVDRYCAKPITTLRSQLGLPKVSARALRRRRTEAEWPILHGFSPTVVPRPRDWRRGLEVVRLLVAAASPRLGAAGRCRAVPGIRAAAGVHRLRQPADAQGQGRPGVRAHRPGPA